MAIEIVDFLIKNCDFPVVMYCKRLPEGLTSRKPFLMKMMLYMKMMPYSDKRLSLHYRYYRYDFRIFMISGEVGSLIFFLMVFR